MKSPYDDSESLNRNSVTRDKQKSKALNTTVALLQKQKLLAAQKNQITESTTKLHDDDLNYLQAFSSEFHHQKVNQPSLHSSTYTEC